MARWLFIRRRRLRSTVMWVILWLSASSGLFEVEARRGRLLFFRSLDPATATDLAGPATAADVAGGFCWATALVSDSDTWVMQLSSCSISAVCTWLRQRWLCIRSRSWKLDSCANEGKNVWWWSCCSASSCLVSSPACMAPWSS